jgi:hypothetical protein
MKAWFDKETGHSYGPSGCSSPIRPGCSMVETGSLNCCTERFRQRVSSYAVSYSSSISRMRRGR